MGHLSLARPQTEGYIELNILPYACFGHKNGPQKGIRLGSEQINFEKVHTDSLL